MKRLTLLFVTIAMAFSSCTNQPENNSSFNSNSQPTIVEPTSTTEGRIEGDIGGCAFTMTSTSNNIILYYPSSKETDQINSILNFSGLASNFKIYAADIDNALAAVHNSQRYILYDPELLAYSDRATGSYWSSMSILAHEIGHHLSGHTITHEGSNPVDELEADKFSGFILFKLGASLSQATAAMEVMGSSNESVTHPAKYRRIAAIEAGWNEANQQRYSSAVPPPPYDDDNFETGGYIKDEFRKEELISESALSADNFGGIINGNSHPTLEGIIIDVSNEDPSGGGRAEYFDEPYSDFNMVVNIQLTKIGDSNWENRKVGDRINFHLLDYYQMSKVDYSWFQALMVPGRKIRFKSIYFGYGAEDIYYIKRLRRDSDAEVSRSSAYPESSNNYSVISSKAHFHSSPESASRRGAYLLFGESVSALKETSGFVYVEYYNSKGQKTSGWISKNDLSK